MRAQAVPLHYKEYQYFRSTIDRPGYWFQTEPMLRIKLLAGRFCALAAISLYASSVVFGATIASVQGPATNGLAIGGGDGAYAVAITNSNSYAWDNVTISAKVGLFNGGTFDAYYFPTLDSTYQTDPGTIHANVPNPSGIQVNTTLFTNLVIPAMTTVYFAITDNTTWWGDYYTSPTVTTASGISYSYKENFGSWFNYTPGYNFNFTVTGDVLTPEPASILLVSTGLALLGGFAYRRRSCKTS